MKKKVKVTINGSVVLAVAGTTLSDLLDIEKPCGGHGTCGKCKVMVDGREDLACRYVLQSDVVVETAAKSEIVSLTGTVENGRLTENLCLCLDIGTTTLALSLVSLDEKKTVRVITSTNPQRIFGADVITRIEHCQKRSVKGLHDALIREINRMIESLDVGEVNRMYVAGNVTMLHTFFGVDCTSIGVAPYTPAFLESKKANAQEIGIRGVQEVVSLPSISSFVGSDIVAGLYLLGMPRGNKYNLLVDLGTNAEVVLYSERKGIATAAAAGPCFEGANISCGMSATKGAICAFRLTDGRATIETIANEKAVGICGTGLIDCISALLKNGVIDETGYMEEDYELSDGVSLSTEDVRQYQLAKSAVYSAMRTLMKTEGIGFEDIETLYISGGFSASINVANAVSTGLLPKELATRTVALNNTSLQGTVKYACEDGDIDHYIKTIRAVDLSSDQTFSELFVENMMFYKLGEVHIFEELS